MNHTTSFWLDNNTAQIVRVLYISYASWDKTLMVDVNLNTGTLTFYDGNDEIARRGIADFQITSSTDEHNCGYRLLGEGSELSAYDKSIVLDALGKVKEFAANNPGNNYGHLLKLHMESAFYPYSYFDAKYFSCKEIVGLFNNQYQMMFSSGDTKDDFYCGITNDLDIRMDQHRNNDFCIVDERVVAYVCATVPMAQEVEYLMAKEKFSIEREQGENPARYAGNGAVKDSVIVYLLKKGELVRKN